VIYHIDEEETPYKCTVYKPANEVTLADFKAVLPSIYQRFKFFFKSNDDDFGVVKEEIMEESAILPLYNGRIVSWLVAAEGSVVGVLSDASGGTHGSRHFRANRVTQSGMNLDDQSTLSVDGDHADLVLRDEAESSTTAPPIGLERESGVGQTRPPSFHGSRIDGRQGIDVAVDQSVTNTETDSLMSSRQDGEDIYDDTESSITSVSQIAMNRRRREAAARASGNPRGDGLNAHRRGNRPPRLPGPGIPVPSGAGGSASTVGLNPMGPITTTATETSSMLSSDVESSLYEDTEDINSMASSSRFTTSTEHTSVSRNMINMRHRQKKRSRRKVPNAHLARAGSISSITDSTMSLNIISVTLNMDTVNFLGISIVGQSNKFGDGDCGIYVGSIMKGGAVALDGRIEPGDMILQVNETNFENMTNDDAVRVLREVVTKPGPIKLVVAKCWEQTPSRGYLSMPRQEPVRPIDPGAWVAHTAAVRGDYPGRAPSVTTLSASSLISSQAETEKYLPGATSGGIGMIRTGHQVDGNNGMFGAQSTSAAGLQQAIEANQILDKDSPMVAIVRAMQKPDSGLEVRDRTWLKIKIPNAFLGSDMVDWLLDKVEGFQNRRDAKKYAEGLVKASFVKHTLHRTTFSEQCYYAFNDDISSISAGLQNNLKLNDSLDSGRHSETQPLLSQQPQQHYPTQQQHILLGPPPGPLQGGMAQLPLVSGGSGGSSNIQQTTGGIWGANPGNMGFAPAQHTSQQQAPIQQQGGTNWEMPWTGPPSGGSGSNTTYGPIYNPAAPPPSASNYVTVPHGYPQGNYMPGAPPTESSYGYQQQLQSNISSSGSSHQGVHINQENGITGATDQNPGNNLKLAGSGSGSESASDHNGHVLGLGVNGQPSGIQPHAGSDHTINVGHHSNRPLQPLPGLRAVPPPVITTSTILSHDGIGPRSTHQPQAIFQAQ